MFLFWDGSWLRITKTTKCKMVASRGNLLYLLHIRQCERAFLFCYDILGQQRVNQAAPGWGSLGWPSKGTHTHGCQDHCHHLRDLQPLKCLLELGRCSHWTTYLMVGFSKSRLPEGNWWKMNIQCPSATFCWSLVSHSLSSTNSTLWWGKVKIFVDVF
jgi:hypothetical protein